MKRLCALFFILCLYLSCAYASAETEDRLTSLSNKSMVSVLNKNGYKGWKLYQPGPREENINTSSKSFLKNIDLYPIVAVKDSETRLIVLEKKKNDWQVMLVSDKAISRDGFRLCGFSMDENVSDTLYFYFDFADAEDRTYTLNLELSRKYPSCFSLLSLPAENTDSGYVYRSIVMNYDRDFDFELDIFGGAVRERIGVEPWQSYEFGIEDFSFADMPLSIRDLTKQAVVKAAPNGAGLYRYPMEAAEPVLVLNEGDTADIVKLVYDCDHWMIVCVQDHVYFARSEVFE